MVFSTVHFEGQSQLHMIRDASSLSHPTGRLALNCLAMQPVKGLLFENKYQDRMYVCVVGLPLIVIDCNCRPRPTVSRSLIVIVVRVTYCY